MMRKIIEMALAAGRKMQNSQTGFVHRSPPGQEEEYPVAIPILDNLLFALTLFRSRSAEQIAEGKALLERILYFQNLYEGPSVGNFPIYLHDYPKCSDAFQALSLLRPLYWIMSQFHMVLGNDLRQKVATASAHLLRYSKQLCDAGIPPTAALKYAAAAKAFGELTNDATLCREGKELLEVLANGSNRHWWASPSALGCALASLQIAYPSLISTPWEEFWHYIGSSWHASTCAFTGPAFVEYQQEFELKPSLYDLYLGALTGTFSKRVLAHAQQHLEGALIHPFAGQLSSVKIKPPQGFRETTDLLALSLLETKEGRNKAQEVSFHPFRLIWGDPERVHSLSCQGGRVLSSFYKTDERKVEIFFDLEDQPDEEDREKSREICFFLDIHERHKIFVEQQLASTFRIGEKVSIDSGPINLSLHFYLEEGKGAFIGHIMKGNRPAQTAVKGKNRFDAYDWQIFLRSVQRSSRCRLRTTIEW